MKIMRVLMLLACVLVVSCASAPPAAPGLSGQVAWGSTPLENASVRAVLSPGKVTDQAVAEGVTDATGRFLLQGVPAGKYTLYVVPSGEGFAGWLGVPVTVPESGNASVGTVRVSKKMTISAPMVGEIVTSPRPTLAWQEFPGAAGYRVDLWMMTEPPVNLLRQPVTGTSLVVPKDLDAGQYQWAVSALSAEGFEIAYSAGNVFSIKR